MVCWKMYNICATLYIYQNYSRYRSATDEFRHKPIITTCLILLPRELWYRDICCRRVSVCHKCDISTSWKISRYFPTTEIHLPAKGGLLSGCWFQQREMQSLICFNSVSGPPIAFRSGRWPAITATLISSWVAAKLSYKYMLSLGLQGLIGDVSVRFCQSSIKKAKLNITQVKVHARHKSRTGRIELW